MSKWIKYIAGTLWGLFFIMTTAVAQTNVTQNMPASEYSEELNLVIDRNIYLTGEDIWFYANLISHNKELLSKTLYVELYNKDNAVRKKFSIEDGACEGYFIIPADFNSGGYLMRAYTNYQKNFLPEHFAHQVMFIINPRKGIRKNGKFTLPTKENADSTGPASPFLPNTYSAVHQMSNNPVQSVTIDRLRDNYRVNFLTGASDAATNGLYFLVRNSSFERVMYERVVGNEKLIPADKLSPGLNYFVLMNDSVPIVTGCIYEQAAPLKQLKLNTEKATYAPRENVRFSHAGYIDNPQDYRAIVSVARKGTHFREKDTSFIYRLVALNPYLLNDYQEIFPGFQPLPNRYLSIALQNHVAALKKNQRFLGKITHNTLEYVPDIYDLSLAGHLSSKKDSVQLTNRAVYLSLFGENPQFHVYNTREDGFFIFNIENLSGIQDAYLTTGTEEKEVLDIMVKSDFSKAFYADKMPMLIDTSYRELIRQMYLTQQIQNKFKSSDSALVSSFTSIPSIERNAEVIYMKDYVELPTMTEVLKEIAPNVFVRKRKGKNKILVFDEKRDFLYEDPLILLDNIPGLDDQTIFSVAPAKVEKIFVIPEPYYIGNHKFNGVVSIVTKTDDFGGAEFNGNSIFLKYTTYSPSATFVKSVPNVGHRPYFSNLLFWQVADFEKLQKSFESSDNEGEYEIFLRILSNSVNSGFLGKERFLLKKE